MRYRFPTGTDAERRRGRAYGGPTGHGEVEVEGLEMSDRDRLVLNSGETAVPARVVGLRGGQPALHNTVAEQP